MEKMKDLLNEKNIETESLICPNEDYCLKIKCDIGGNEISIHSDDDNMLFSMGIEDFYDFIEELKKIKEFLEKEIK